MREELMRRLIEVGNAADQTDDFRWNHSRAMPAIVEEVIRQMEWARRLDDYRKHLSAHMDDDGNESNYLTIAPPEWNL